MVAFWPGTKQNIDNGFGGSRNGDPIDGVVIHHTANGGGQSALGYVANENSRDSHPTYLVQNSGDAFGIVAPDRRPYSTGGRPDTQAVSFEIDNSAGAPNWPTSPQAKETVAQIVAYHYLNSRRKGGGIARNIPGVEQSEFFVAWHSQYVATACPGPEMVDQGGLDWIINRAMQIANPPVTPPTNPNTTVTVGSTVGVKAPFGVYSNTAAALAGGAPAATYPAGNYTVFKVSNGCVNLTKTPGKPGGWAVISKLGLTDPTPPVVVPPAPVIFNVVFDDSPADPNSDYAKVKVESGKLVPKPTDPAKEGYTFVGWFDHAAPLVAFDFSKPVTKGYTLDAMFDKIPVPPEDEYRDFIAGLGTEIDTFLGTHKKN